MGKGGDTTYVESSQEIDPRLYESGVRALDAAEAAMSIPYIPNRGLQVAAFTPMQMAAMEGQNTAAEAFGLPAAPIVQPQVYTSPSGVSGYQSGDLYDANINASIDPQLQRNINMLFAPNRPAAGKGGNMGVNEAGTDPVERRSYSELYNPTPLEETPSGKGSTIDPTEEEKEQEKEVSQTPVRYTPADPRERPLYSVYDKETGTYIPIYASQGG